ncbi:hypothetical protein BAUCODRAFT_382879 [Baudoinia panamericana UAMH 10762]|uniref:Uncharacterized protein n=1 Tax=Baudoinia panamericana (strain UAMH 10762) TaxID=717646 RepID=M2NIF7_BAUPA|nr:uncharacterized protein BAUCODRAFT_382879 [Baudoinia panamericana UAMH 10762]EMC98875.1 hypothetical protein BAUCODRAFT_382879 [Baudoinia panamericana UAMH 10762]
MTFQVPRIPLETVTPSHQSGLLSVNRLNPRQQTCVPIPSPSPRVISTSNDNFVGRFPPCARSARRGNMSRVMPVAVWGGVSPRRLWDASGRTWSNRTRLCVLLEEV